ncbi:EXS family protein [Botrytis cinerea]
MDGDPAVENELDSFSRTLPLPYRVALIIVLGVWAWGANLHYFSIVKINTLTQVPRRMFLHSSNTHNELLHELILRIICLRIDLLRISQSPCPLHSPLLALSHRDPALVIYYDFLPITYICLLFLAFLVPLRRASYSGRLHFLSALKRVSVGGLALPNEGKFGDILLADVLTSYAKIIADLFVSFCMFFTPSGSATSRPDRGCGGQYIVPIMIAIPSLIRFRQCIIEYLRVKNSRSSASGWGGQHLANALKYSTAFPVIIFSAMQRNLSVNETSINITTTTLYRFWLLSVLINSLYSFYWDVTKDWDLTLLTPSSRNTASYPLRPRLYLPTKELYYMAILFDFLLRFTWSLKLSPHLDHFADFESGIFLLEVLEVARRWMWIFLRVETEWGREKEKGNANGLLGGPGVDDVLLGDYRDEDDYSD